MSDRGEIAEWVAYLRDIGVRELHAPVGAVGPARRAVSAPPAGTPPESSRRPAATGPVLIGGKSGFESAPPKDPARRLNEIRETIGDCTRCKLHERRTNIVFGVGDPAAKLMFVGEGPGADEDAKGEPFVGRAGKKLDEMILAIGLKREEVYIANVVKCRPPGNRDPEKDEIETCSPFLHAQIEAIRPRVIVTLGSPATKLLLSTKIGITKLRGQFHDYFGIPVMPTYHPAYLLRRYTPENRRTVWEDLKAARRRVDESD